MKRRWMAVLLSGCSLFTVLSAASLATGHVLRAQAGAKFVYLTFDDGPDALWTPRILDILKREHVHATFFVLGFKSEQCPALVRRIHREGHEIGNHGYYHTFIVHKSKSWVERDVRRADAAIQAVAGIRPQYFRPPGGILSPSDVGLVTHIGHPIAMWTVDTNDWRAKSSTTIIAAVRTAVRPGSIILMHDGITSSSRFTAQALPTVIHSLRQQGYSFRVLPEHTKGSTLGGPTDTRNRRFASR